MLARLGSGGSEQRNHLHHRRKDCAIGLRSRESFLYRALRRQPPYLAQDRGFVTVLSVAPERSRRPKGQKCRRFLNSRAHFTNH